jgi:Putative collagen-binding domain of a collagenase
MLSGGKGQFYGNFYTWSFASGWKYYIDTPGAAQVTIWKGFFSTLPWQDLVPDQDHSVLTAGLGNYGNLQTPVSISDYATASKTPDGSYVVLYMPTVRTITVNMASLKGSAVAKWFDPTNGTYTSISGQALPNKGTQQFTPPGSNHDGDGDWVLLLDASK